METHDSMVTIIMLVNGYERYDKMEVRWIFWNCKNSWFISLLFFNINKNRISSNLLRIFWIDVLKSLDDNNYYYPTYHKVKETLLRDTLTNLFWWVRSENFGESQHCKNKKNFDHRWVASENGESMKWQNFCLAERLFQCHTLICNIDYTQTTKCIHIYSCVWNLQ